MFKVAQKLYRDTEQFKCFEDENFWCILGGLCFDILKAYSYIPLICSQCLQRQSM
ncbi:hypothetical protein PVAP13_9KG041187 [Panicum virgatum]|uniref:Uncharacterized protein n=1 Tax=Panicum virgatum TaxID=38727 RepID=A0A8T0NGR5_PANVG|nr:hypothetical protein PVAP13_9KG041187 [Panicum virgatum]